MALHARKGEKRKAALRKHDKKGFHSVSSFLSTTLVTKPRGGVSIIPSLKANNKQLAAALDESRQKVRRHEEHILKLQQEHQELLQRNAKSERCIQSLQSSLPKAEQLLHEAGVKITEAKESIVQAKEVAMKCSIRDSSGKSIDFVTSDSLGGTVRMEQPRTSTPLHSPPAKRDIDLACSMFDEAFKDELSVSLTDFQTLASSTLSQDKSDALLQEIAEESSEDKFKIVTTDLSSLPVTTHRPKRHCTELATSYAEDDLARKFYGQEGMEILSSDVPALKQKKAQQKLKKKSTTALRNITNVM